MTSPVANRAAKVNHAIDGTSDLFHKKCVSSTQVVIVSGDEPGE
jgi:hypothetical protein